MNKLVIRWLVNALALLLVDQLVRGMAINGFIAALVAAGLWGFANAFIRPFFNFLAAPLNIATLGLFTFVVNGFLLYLIAYLVEGFSLTFWSAIGAAFLLSIVSSLLNLLVFDR